MERDIYLVKTSGDGKRAELCCDPRALEEPLNVIVSTTHKEVSGLDELPFPLLELTEDPQETCSAPSYTCSIIGKDQVGPDMHLAWFLSLKQPADVLDLTDASIEELLALCENYDFAPA